MVARKDISEIEEIVLRGVKVIIRKNDCASLCNNGMCFIKGKKCDYFDKTNCEIYFQYVHGREKQVYASKQGQEGR
ncbi:MAG: hypothetical protein AABY22_35795 [Nanoarchaeota archaeon]